MNLRKLQEAVIPADVFASVRKVPPIKILSLLNETTAEKISGLKKRNRNWPILASLWLTTLRTTTHWNLLWRSYAKS